MKTVLPRLALVLAPVFLFGYTRAAEPEVAFIPASSGNSATLVKALNQQLNKHITFPLLEREHNMEGVVAVSFVVNAEGRIELLSATSENDALCDYVIRKLGKVDIGENPSGSWRTSHVRFVFRPEA